MNPSPTVPNQNPCLKLGLISAACLALFVSGLSGCSEDPNALNGGRSNTPSGEGDPATDPENLPEALQCTAKPEGRSYILFDGTKMEQQRANENVGVNRARLKPYAVMATEYQRVLGLVPEGIKTSGGSFDDPPARWYAESAYSGVSMNAIFEISFEGCLKYTRAATDLKALPTTETAQAECTRLMRKAWSRSPSPEEIAGCTDLAVTKLATQTDIPKRWAYVCSSVLSSSQFLTF